VRRLADKNYSLLGAAAFYRKFGLEPSPAHPAHLFLLFKDIRRSLEEA
jgi:hypothetical protein